MAILGRAHLIAALSSACGACHSGAPALTTDAAQTDADSGGDDTTTSTEVTDPPDTTDPSMDSAPTDPASGDTTTGAPSAETSGDASAGVDDSTGDPVEPEDGSSTGDPIEPEGGLRVVDRTLRDPNGEVVVFRGVEHVIRWGEYQGDIEFGDVPYEGAAADVSGGFIDDIAQAGANAVRILGGFPEELEPLLHEAIVEQKLWVSLARVDWTDPAVLDAVERYGDYITLHAQGEVVGDDPDVWRETVIHTITQMRALGYTQPLEVYANGYGQRLSTILAQGEAAFDADPLGNVVFGVQLYSELAADVEGSLDQVLAFPHPIFVGACRFNEGIINGWGNSEMTHRQVWDETYERDLPSFYWDWTADGNGNRMSDDGTLGALTDVGQYIVHQSPAALMTTTVKSAFLLDAHVEP